MDDFQHDRWYCLRCPLHPEANSFPGEYSVKCHVRDKHEADYNSLERGVEFAEGVHAERIYHRRVEVIEHELPALQRTLADPNYSAEDFLLDFPPIRPEEAL